MKVLHVIPSAFNYYDDIKAAAFALIESETRLGIEAEAYTIQYTTPVKKDQNQTPAEQSETAPASRRRYLGTVTLADVIKELPTCDVLHVHTPIFGALGSVLIWMKKFPHLRLIVTVHRPSRTPDFFSLIFLIYNRVFLPRLFRAAAYIATPNMPAQLAYYGRLIRKWPAKLVEVDEALDFLDVPLVQDFPAAANLTASDRLAFKYSILYTVNK